MCTFNHNDEEVSVAVFLYFIEAEGIVEYRY